MSMNGWISVFEDEKPESGEQVLCLSYIGYDIHVKDPFADPDDRIYQVCTYFYSGDTSVEEDKEAPNPLHIRKCVFQEEGFYVYEVSLSAGGACRWRRLTDYREEDTSIMFWKRLDWPTDFDAKLR